LEAGGEDAEVPGTMVKRHTRIGKGTPQPGSQAEVRLPSASPTHERTGKLRAGPEKMRRVEQAYEEWRRLAAEADQDEGWERRSMEEIIVLTELGPEESRWRWGRMSVGGRVFMILTEPDGTKWRFRLQRGVWVKRLPL
jgi:hypothetical protein